MLPALSINSYLEEPCLIEGSTIVDVFEAFIEKAVLPQCERYPRRRSVLVMDNCRTHRREVSLLPLFLHSLTFIQILRDLCQQHGVLLVFLPGYSPDFNPIELTFHLLKQWMKRNQHLCPQYGSDNYAELFEAFLYKACKDFGAGVDFHELYRRCHVSR